ncbi:GNAT family N-acetyltransferase [Paenibacillus cymbidii]|uniref:GNAT family N-acetyltransferase n=1 Tax=Paenibacillus cymbidii TaxID=1639034 RepID=UPI001081A88E|nr:GNAT family N-acetyltransferase [Paenibacillus cymbidii]
MAEATVRQLTREDMPEAVKLANAIFRSDGMTPMNEAFPHSFSGDLGQSFGVYVSGELVSFMGLVPAVVRVGPAAISTFLLGQVCTRTDARGNGYAGAVMQAVVDYIERAGGSLMLVSGSRSLYDRFGCMPFGALANVTVGGDWARARLAVREAGLVVRSRETRDWFELKRLADERECRFDFSMWDLAALIGAESKASCMKHVHRAAVAERVGDSGKLAAFLVYTIQGEGKASTRVPQAIEWAGEPAAVTQLMAHAVAAHRLDRFDIPVPVHEQPLMRELGDAAQELRPYPATLHIVDPERLLRQAEPYLRLKYGQGPPDRLHAAKEGHAAVRIGGGSSGQTLGMQAFVDLLFTPGASGDPAAALITGDERVMPFVPLPSPHGLLYV